MQLVQLQNAKQRFEAQGLKLAAVSYDSVEILKSFADRQKIEFPMLSDSDSQVIRAYGVLNEQATGMTKDMALPGYFVIDADGIIQEKFFEDAYQQRFSPNNVIGRLFPELGGEVWANVTAPHLGLAVDQSDRMGFPGSRISLMVEVRLPSDVHVYAPEVQGYKPIQLTISPSSEIELASLTYPPSEILYLPAIQERVPVFEGTFRIRQDITVSAADEFRASLGENGKTIAIDGQLHYQACDSEVCYLPESVPLQWNLQILPLDRQRAPETIRHQ